VINYLGGPQGRPVSFISYNGSFSMTTFQYTPPDDDNEDRVYVRVDDVFDISILRVETGIVIDVYEADEIDLLATLAVGDDSLARNREQRP
jgi:hypothetical protein